MAAVAAGGKNVPASLLAPDLASLNVAELSALLSGATPVNTHTLADALRSVSVKLSVAETEKLEDKNLRVTLEESNFLSRNQILVLQEQLDSLARQYRQAKEKWEAVPDDVKKMVKRRNKKAAQQQAQMALANSNSAAAAPDDISSSDDEGTADKKALIGGGNTASGVRFTRDALRVSASFNSSNILSKRGSMGSARFAAEKENEAAEKPGRPPMLQRAQSISKIKQSTSSNTTATGGSNTTTSQAGTSSPEKDRSSTGGVSNDDNHRRQSFLSSSRSPRATLNPKRSSLASGGTTATGPESSPTGPTQTPAAATDEADPPDARSSQKSSRVPNAQFSAVVDGILPTHSPYSSRRHQRTQRKMLHHRERRRRERRGRATTWRCRAAMQPLMARLHPAQRRRERSVKAIMPPLEHADPP